MLPLPKACLCRFILCLFRQGCSGHGTWAWCNSPQDWVPRHYWFLQNSNEKYGQHADLSRAFTGAPRGEKKLLDKSACLLRSGIHHHTVTVRTFLMGFSSGNMIFVHRGIVWSLLVAMNWSHSSCCRSKRWISGIGILSSACVKGAGYRFKIIGRSHKAHERVIISFSFFTHTTATQMITNA